MWRILCKEKIINATYQMTELEVFSLKFILVLMLKNIPLVVGGVAVFLLVSTMIKSQQVTKPVNDLSTSDIISKLPQDSCTDKIKKAYLLTIKNENEVKIIEAVK